VSGAFNVTSALKVRDQPFSNLTSDTPAYNAKIGTGWRNGARSLRARRGAPAA